MKAGQVVGLYSMAEGTESGVKAVMLPAGIALGMSQNITYDFETMSIDDVASIDTSSTSINSVPNVRPLISAVIEGEIMHYHYASS